MTAEKRAALAGIVTIDKEIMHGTPCFTGTRVPVQTLLDFIEAGDTLDKFLLAFPRVQREQAIQFLELAKEQLLVECVSS
jgi:uncharacterized protein (DUF433 family)